MIQIIFFSHFVRDLRDTITGGTVTSDYFSGFFFFLIIKEEQSSDQNQEEGWEVQDGSTRVRRVVNSGQPLTVEEGGTSEDWEVCSLYLFHRSVFSRGGFLILKYNLQYL